MKQLYSIYDKSTSLGYGNYPVFIVAFGGDKNKAEKYVNNYLLYGNVDWESFDGTVNAVLTITDDKLSLKQFKDQPEKFG